MQVNKKQYEKIINSGKEKLQIPLAKSVKYNNTDRKEQNMLYKS